MPAETYSKIIKFVGLPDIQQQLVEPLCIEMRAARGAAIHERTCFASGTVRRVAIVGGGFSGTMVAAHLLQQARRPLIITLFNNAYPVSRGVAYSSVRNEHLITLPVIHSSAYQDDSTHLARWLASQDASQSVDEHSKRFISRQVYGTYMTAILHAAILTRPVYVDFSICDNMEIIDLTNDHELVASDGSTFSGFDDVVLATGNEASIDVPVRRYDPIALGKHPNWCNNPWEAWWMQLPPVESSTDKDVVILGTGLTAVDVVLTLLHLGWKGSIHATSRNGLLPIPHFSKTTDGIDGVDNTTFPGSQFDPLHVDIESLVNLFRADREIVRLHGGHPARLIDKISPHVITIWKHLSLADKQRFVQKYATQFKTLRQKVAPEIVQQLQRAANSGQLQVHKVSLDEIRIQDSEKSRMLHVIVQANELLICLKGDFVINCTGPCVRMSKTRSQLLRSLIKSGKIQIDDMDMGICVNAQFQVLPITTTHRIFAMGPLLRGQLWDSIAVYHLRTQATMLASSILF